MARQKSPIKLQGTISDINYYRGAEGFMARESNPVTAERILNDPNFARVRENIAEFKRAAQAGSILRQAVKSLLAGIKDKRVTGRTTSQMVKVIKADNTSARGLRNVIDGEATLLKGFDFNANASMESTLKAEYTAVIDRVAGTLTINAPAFNPDLYLKSPAGATHFKIVSLGTEIDFEAGTYVSDAKESAMIPCGATTTGLINMVSNVTPNSTHPLFLVFGIQFYQLVSGEYYAIKAGSFNALRIAEVDGGV